MIKKNESPLTVYSVQEAVNLGNADKIEKVILRVKTDSPEMYEIKVFDAYLSVVDFDMTYEVVDDSYVRDADNFKGYVEVNVTPTYTYTLNNFKPEYNDDLLFLHCDCKNAKIENVQKEELKEVTILEKTFSQMLDGDKYQMYLKVFTSKYGVEGLLTSTPRGVYMEACGKDEILSRFNSTYLPVEVIKSLQETLKEF